MTTTPFSEFTVEGIVRSNVIHPEPLFTRIFWLPNSSYEIWNYEFYVALPDIHRGNGGIEQVTVHNKPCGDSFPIKVEMKPEQGEIHWWFAPYSKAEIVLVLSEVRDAKETLRRVAYWFVSDVYSEEDASFIRNAITQVANKLGFDSEGKAGTWTWSVQLSPDS